MKNKLKHIVILLSYLFAILYLVSLLPIDSLDKGDIKILILHNPKLSGTFSHILEAYESMLEEEGVPYKAVSPDFILSAEPEEIVRNFPVIIMPDGISRSLPSDLKFWCKEFLQNGGHVAVIFDSGSQNLKSQFLNRGIFADMLGLNYVSYNQLLDSNMAYTNGHLRFKNTESANFFQMTPGKTDDHLVVTGYSYGQLIYPMARLKIELEIDKKNVYAYGFTDAGETYPAIILKKILKGNLLYVNLPLGHLKANSDDFLLRSLMRTFLFKVAKIPHLMNTPEGKGGLVINWHIDWHEDWAGLTYMKENGFFTPHIKYSIHNTAGPFNVHPGDKTGFDACGKGRELLHSVLPYGTLGSHGGWAHDWFYTNIMNGRFGEKEMEYNILRNSKCLESITGYPIIEYSAPNGVHPQPITTQILERNGIIAYYYTGDSGSSPNRTFYNKKMVSRNVIAFPTTSYRETASFYEMDQGDTTPEQIHEWLHGLLEFVVENRSIRLIYSHSYDVYPHFPETVKQFIMEVEKQSEEGKLLVQPMSYFAQYIQRFLKTRYRFHQQKKNLQLWLSNPMGLKGIVVALPVDQYKLSPIQGVIIQKEKNYYILRITENTNDKIIYIPYLNH